VRLHRDPSLIPIYRKARMRLLDSRVVARVARWLGLRGPRVAPGSDVTALLLRHHLRPGERITIVGLPAESVCRLVSDLALVPPAHLDPPMGFDRDPACFAAAVRFVVSHPARFVFLAVGSPRQELLAAAIAATGEARGIGLCIGASLAFLAGVERRAPPVLQRAGLEWLFRLACHPYKLWRRYLVDSPVVLALLMAERRRQRRFCRQPGERGRFG
jgi:exopolysaccharide biosynthesis WecB/TagA/CpsF family protein